MNTNPKKRSIGKTVCAILAVLLVLSGAELLYSNLALTVSRYTLRSEKVDSAIRIVFLSDLHGREFGTDNERLLKKIAGEKPDLIALVGDIVNNNATADEIGHMCGFIQRVSEIAPVYYSLGNHENSYLRSHETDLLERIRRSGAVVLESEYLDVEIHGIPLRIGGYMGYYRQPIMTTSDPEQVDRELAFADAFEATDRFRLLLNHIPTMWLDWSGINRYPVDLVLSGHYHGGLIRIPILERGVIVPNARLFPPYTKGQFEGSEATCVLTTGLAGSKWPRFFNPPEIVAVDILPAE